MMQGMKRNIILAVICTVFLKSAPSHAELNFKCPGDGIFPNPEDCATYIYCSAQIPTVMPCGPGTLYDPVDKVCKIPSQVNCNAASTSTSSTTTTTTTTTARPTTTSTSTTSTASPATSTGKPSGVNCPETGTALVPNPNSCTSFYVCIEGRSEIENCPPGYGFNNAQGRCTLDNNDCNPNGPTTTPSPDQPKCPSEKEQRFPNPKDCKSFYVCLNGFSYLISCPVNSQYDSEASQCTDAASDVCGDYATPNPVDLLCASHPDGALLPDPDDCSKFYHCSHGKAVKQSCPPGLLFDEEAESCVLPSMANCN